MRSRKDQEILICGPDLKALNTFIAIVCDNHGAHSKGDWGIPQHEVINLMSEDDHYVLRSSVPGTVSRTLVRGLSARLFEGVGRPQRVQDALYPVHVVDHVSHLSQTPIMSAALVLDAMPRDKADLEFLSDSLSALLKHNRKHMRRIIIVLNDALQLLEVEPPWIDALHAWRCMLAGDVERLSPMVHAASLTAWQHVLRDIDARWQNRLGHFAREVRRHGVEFVVMPVSPAGFHAQTGEIIRGAPVDGGTSFPFNIRSFVFTLDPNCPLCFDMAF